MPQSPDANADLILSAFLEAFATGRRVLWIGDPATGAPERMAAFCNSVLVLDTSGRGRRRRSGVARVKLYRPGALELEADSFDLVVIPELAVLEDVPARVVELAAAVGDGLLLAGTSLSRFEGDAIEAAFQSLDAPLGESFREVRMFGLAGFAGFAVADLESDSHDAVLVDTSLLDAGQPVERYLALAGDELPQFEPFTVLQVPTEQRQESEPTQDREVDALRSELERSLSRLEHLQTRLMATERELSEARAALRVRGNESDGDEVARLEQLLAERSREVRLATGGHRPSRCSGARCC